MILNNRVKKVYMNADGNVQELFDKTVAAKALRDGTLVKISGQKKEVDKRAFEYNEAVTQGDACKAARDAKNTGIAKNNACHVDVLNGWVSKKATRLTALNAAKNILSQYESDLVKHEAQLQTATSAYNAAAGANLSTAPSDPNLANVLGNYVDSNGNVKSDFTKYLKIGGGILVVGTVIFVVVKVLKK